MQERVPYTEHAPDLYRKLVDVSMRLQNGSLDRRLIHLVFLRASQINGCAFCVDMHYWEARADGEDVQRLNNLVTWRETTFYSEAERAALAFTEDVTRVAETGAPDASYEALRSHFSDVQIAELGFAIAVINSWNRLAIAFRTPVSRRTG